MGEKAGGATRGGGDGVHNEDFFAVDEGLGLYVVCDGDGLLPGGEVASRITVEAIEEFVSNAHDQFESAGEKGLRRLMATAMQFAFAAISDVEDSESELTGLTTTTTAMLVRRHTAVVAHRGDSRAYLVRGGLARQLTVDHELTEELGDADRGRGFDLFAFDLEVGDCVILCTDGAETALDDRALLRMCGDGSPKVLASRVVSAAHRADAGQDATAVVVQVSDGPEPCRLRLSNPPRTTRFGYVIAG